MALTFNGTTDGLVGPYRAGFDSTSGTVACLFKTTQATTGNLLRHDDNTTRHWLFRMESSKVTWLVIYGGNPSVVSLANKDDGNWHSAVATWSWNGSTTTTIELWIDGASQGTNTASASNPTGNLVPVGIGWADHFTSEYFAGDLAEPAIWNSALAAGEIGALAKGYSPLAVRRANLVLHVPLVRNTLDTLTTAPTVSGSPTVAAHPRIIMPARRSRVLFVPSAVAAGVTYPQLERGIRGLHRGVAMGSYR